VVGRSRALGLAASAPRGGKAALVGRTDQFKIAQETQADRVPSLFGTATSTLFDVA
jgi:hypothetical protein